MLFLLYALPFILIFLCFWFPYKSGKKEVGIITGMILLGITIFGFYAGDYFVGFALLLILAISIVFLTYWIFRYYKKKKLATILAIVISVFFLYLVLSPWIDDWTFSSNDARKILKERGFVLNDKIKILSNESGGLRDYYHTFLVSLSGNDYKQIKNQIISQRNYLGKKDNTFWAEHSGIEINRSDTITYENEDFYKWDEASKDEHGHSTRYLIQLNKHKNQLSFDEDD